MPAVTYTTVAPTAAMPEKNGHALGISRASAVKKLWLEYGMARRTVPIAQRATSAFFDASGDSRARTRARIDRRTSADSTARTLDRGAMSDHAHGDAPPYDHLVKLLLVGDSGVGKSSLLMRFVADKFEEVSPTIGVDFKLKYVDVHGKKLKLTVWDTAGQERFRTLTSSYYRGAQGVIFVYDITSEETFENLRDVWRKEVELYSTIENAVKIVIGNKVDKEADRAISREKGVAFAKEFGCLFLECSAKTNRSVQEAFDELVKGILEAPGLLSELGTDDPAVKLGAYGESTSGCC